MSYDESDFEYGTGGGEDEGSGKRRLRRWVVPAALVLLAGSGAIAWIIVDRMGGGEPGPVPLIEAESEPDKVKPEEPGGMEVPNQDKLVYDQMTGESGAAAPEQLLPEAEEPALPAGGEGTAGTPLEPAQPAETAAAEASVPPEAAGAAAPSAGETPAKEEVAAAEEAAPAAEAKVSVGDFLVQVASVKSEEAAEKEALRLAKVAPDLLGGLAHGIQRVDLGADKGVYYRTRFGPLDRAAADALCANLKERKLDCLVVKN